MNATIRSPLAWLQAIVTCALLLAGQAHAAPPHAETGVPYATDLRRDAALAGEKDGIVLVMFSAEHCRYCEQVLNEFLLPLTRLPDYQAKLVLRRVDTRSRSALRGFDGGITDQRRFAREQGVRVVPTLMLFAPDGRRLGAPMVGLTTPDYYGYFLDQAILQAVETVRSGRPVTP